MRRLQQVRRRLTAGLPAIEDDALQRANRRLQMVLFGSAAAWYGLSTGIAGRLQWPGTGTLLITAFMAVLYLGWRVAAVRDHETPIMAAGELALIPGAIWGLLVAVPVALGLQGLGVPAAAAVGLGALPFFVVLVGLGHFIECLEDEDIYRENTPDLVLQAQDWLRERRT